jgi:flagellar biosynthesis GTPase FlhF
MKRRERVQEVKKEDVEKERRMQVEEAQLKMRSEEVELRREEIVRQKDKEVGEREKNESVVYKMKLFGEAMRGTVFQMSSDPIELIPFFEHIENVFSELKVDET